MRIAELFAFMVERHEIHRRRGRGEPKPWTTNPILQRWRFCNVYRELDRVTKWIADNWREPHKHDPDPWFALTVARLVNWPDTLADIGYPLPWDRDRFINTSKARQQRGQKVFTAAYKIPVPQAKGDCRVRYLADSVLTPTWKDRASLRLGLGDTLARAHAMLATCYWLGSFLAAQIVADLKYVEPLRGAPDRWTLAAPGPGSRRGLNRVLGRSIDATWTDAEWLRCLQRLHAEMMPMIVAAKLPRMHAQDLQNNLCEWDKYERERLGEGHPKQRYPGLPDSNRGRKRAPAVRSMPGTP
jgi:hypothetical protein